MLFMIVMFLWLLFNDFICLYILKIYKYIKCSTCIAYHQCNSKNLTSSLLYKLLWKVNLFSKTQKQVCFAVFYAFPILFYKNLINFLHWPNVPVFLKPELLLLWCFNTKFISQLKNSHLQMTQCTLYYNSNITLSKIWRF